jgi:hypothetical protein
MTLVPRFASLDAMPARDLFAQHDGTARMHADYVARALQPDPESFGVDWKPASIQPCNLVGTLKA